METDNLGTDLHSKEEVAIKLMDARDELDILQNEAETYTALPGGTGIPHVLWHGWEGDYYVLVHELLGPSLEDSLDYCDPYFSLKTVLLIADQALSRVEYIHNKGFLHCDVKPDNFLLGVEKRGNTLYTIDFGLSRQMRENRRDPPLQGSSFIGTRRYASLNAHNGHGSFTIGLEETRYS
jgi:casein kinase 1 delta/casein kinase I family protein HRR25